MDAEELIQESERKIQRLRAQINSEELFLRELRRRLPGPTSRTVEVQVPLTSMPRTHVSVERLRASTSALENSLGRLSRAARGEKRRLALEAMCARPGDWSTKDLERLYAEKGIDSAGTPAKNILWHLKREGLVDAKGGGVYFFSPEMVETVRKDESL